MTMHGPPLPLEPRRPTFRAALAWMAPGAWLTYLLAGLLLASGAGLVAAEPALRPWLTIAGFASVAAMLAGVRAHRPARHLPWQIMAAGTVLTTTGAVVFAASPDLAVAGQLLTGLGSVLGFVGFALLIRGRIPGGDRAAFLDAGILAMGFGVVIWSFGFAPLVAATKANTLVAALVFYPTIVALAIAARLWLLHGGHRPATRLIVLNVIAANAVVVLSLLDAPDHSVIAGAYQFARFAQVAIMGAAALHPSMALVPERHVADPQPMSRRRIAILTAALLVNPATLLIEVLRSDIADPAPYLVGSVVIGVLVVARLGEALRQLGTSLRERDALMQLLRHQALYDALTSLPNRSLFTERLGIEFANRTAERPLAVLLIDLDDFKSVNDSYGHEAGDELLVAVGQRLRATIRSGDTAARLGGDEFVIALPAYGDPAVPIRVAQRVLATLADPYDIAGNRVTTRVSVGIAMAGPGVSTADGLVRNADIAMYLAKSRGKGRFEVFEPSMEASALTQLQLRSDLALGIAAGDLRLEYQPIVDLKSGRTVGYEALVRWLHHGVLVSPADFIPIAETSGLIEPLTDWVIEEACRTVATWGNLVHRPWVSVNFSPSQLVRQDIVLRLGRTFASTGLTPDRFVIEITESSLIDIEVARPATERLSRLGVRIAIDDFGIGYSALSYLARLPIDIVKVDRSFVTALQQAGPEEAIASAIIALARRLDMTTVGEGIETGEQLDQLTALGCDLGQGFYLGRPRAAEDLRESLHPHERHIRRPKLAGLGA